MMIIIVMYVFRYINVLFFCNWVYKECSYNGLLRCIFTVHCTSCNARGLIALRAISWGFLKNLLLPFYRNKLFLVYIFIFHCYIYFLFIFFVIFIIIIDL